MVDDKRAAYTLKVEASEAVNDGLNGGCAVEQWSENGGMLKCAIRGWR